MADSWATGKTPRGGGTLIGPYAVIAPCDFGEPPDASFDEKALPLFVSAEQVEGLDMPPLTMTARRRRTGPRSALPTLPSVSSRDAAPVRHRAPVRRAGADFRCRGAWRGR